MSRFKRIISLFLTMAVLVTTMVSFSVSSAALAEYDPPEIEITEGNYVKVRVNVPLKDLVPLYLEYEKKYKTQLYFSVKFDRYDLRLFFNGNGNTYQYEVNVKSAYETDKLTFESKVKVGSDYFSFEFPNGHECAEAIKETDKFIYKYYLITDKKNYIYGDGEEHIYYKGGFKDIADMKITKIGDFAYTGKARKPAVIIHDGETQLKKGTDYTVKYSDNTDYGVATITITGKGRYQGKTKVNFNIVPIKTALKVTKKSDVKVRFAWNPVEGVDGYQIYYSTNGGKYRKITEATPDQRNKTIRKKSFDFENNTYTFKIRSYKDIDGVRYYSNWSKEITLTD